MSGSLTHTITGPCRACLAQIQNCPNQLINEYTPLIQRPQRPENSRCAILLFGLLILILCFGCTIGFYLIVIETRDIQAKDVIIFSSRHNWKAEYPLGTSYLNLPCRKLLLLYTNSPPCFDHHNCTMEIRNLQKNHMENNHSDILYNFVIANDNRIYEGRGWKYISDVPGYTDNVTITIAFSGYPSDSNPMPAQIEQLMLLINLSVTNHKLIHCFDVLSEPDEEFYFRNIINQIQQSFIDTRCN